QKELEDSLRAAAEAEGWSLVRAHREHRRDAEPDGFIHSQAYGREVFEQIHPEAPLIVAEAVWQYSQHVLIGLQRHRGPVLIAANWSGRWPGLVGALNLRGSLAKACVPHSIVWAEDFADPGAREKLRQW